jgi:hypothetical protein
MSTSLALTIPRPRVLDVMGDFMHLEILARVAKVSKTARCFITPIIEGMKRDKQEMYQMLLRLFPGISYLPEGRDASYYNTLLETYFESRVFVPMPVAIGHMIGKAMEMTRATARAANITAMITQADTFNTRILDPYLAGELCYHVRTAMNSIEGRRRLMQSISDWEEALEMTGIGIHDAYTLQILRECVRSDFSIRHDNIGI